MSCTVAALIWVWGGVAPNLVLLLLFLFKLETNLQKGTFKKTNHIGPGLRAVPGGRGLQHVRHRGHHAAWVPSEGGWLLVVYSSHRPSHLGKGAPVALPAAQNTRNSRFTGITTRQYAHFNLTQAGRESESDLSELS